MKRLFTAIAIAAACATGTAALAARVVPADVLDTYQTRAAAAAYPAAAPALQAFVRTALADRLRANDVPDLNLLQSSRRIAVRDVMPQAHAMLKQAALPEIEGYQFFLLSPADAQAGADRRRETVAFITVDEPAIAGDSGSVWLGVDTAIPRASGLLKLCCCTGKAEFHRSGESWTFVNWSTIVCS